MESVCTQCGKTAELTGEGLCFDCNFERLEGDAGRDRKTITVDELVDAIQNTDDPDAIMDLFTRCRSPSDKLEQAKARERVLRALKGKKLSSPTKLVDAWIGSAQEREDATSTQASRLVSLVLERDAVLFHTTDQQGFAAVRVEGHREVLSLRSRSFRLWLARAFYEATSEEAARAAAQLAESDVRDDVPPRDAMMKILVLRAPRVPGAQALSDAIATLEGMAIFGGEELEVYVRIAHVGDLLYVDLGNDVWEGVEITRAGWRVISTPPVMFRRPSGLGELPIPVPGGDISELRERLNVVDSEWPLVVAVVLGLYSPGPYPVPILSGEHGAAKSTAARMIRALIDPNTAPLRRRPRNDHDLSIAANNSWVLNFDNLSALPQWLSDSVCILATGGGFSARLLYSDDEERLFDSKRPVILNGIGTVASSSDLLDRAVLVTLPKIDEKIPEEEFWPAFYEALPRILGVVLDGVVAALAGAQDVPVTAGVRMVDFARWAMAGLPTLGLDAKDFITAYEANQRDADLIAIDSSVIGKLVRQFAATERQWEGSPSDLLHELEDAADTADDLRDRIGELVRPGPTRKQREWPKLPQNLSADLRRLAPNLRRVGVEVQFNRSGAKGRTITITATGSPSPDPGPDDATLRDLEDLAEHLQDSDTSDTSDLEPGSEPGDARDADMQTLSQEPRVGESRRASAPAEADGSPDRDRYTVAGVSGGDKSAPNLPQLSPPDKRAVQHCPAEPGWVQLQQDASEEPEHDEADTFALLQKELGAFESATLDYICQRHREGADFTRITAELNRNGFAPPQGRERWDLANTVIAYGVRHP